MWEASALALSGSLMSAVSASISRSYGTETKSFSGFLLAFAVSCWISRTIINHYCREIVWARCAHRHWIESPPQLREGDAGVRTWSRTSAAVVSALCLRSSLQHRLWSSPSDSWKRGYYTPRIIPSASWYHTSWLPPSKPSWCVLDTKSNIPYIWNG